MSHTTSTVCSCKHWWKRKHKWTDNVCNVHQTGWPWVGPQPCHGGVHCDSQVARNLADQNQVAFRISTPEPSVNTRKRDLSEWKKQNPAGFDTLNTRTILDVETGTMKISGCHSQNQTAFKVLTISQGVNTRIRLVIYQDVNTWLIFSTYSMNYITKRLLICSWSHRSSDRP